MKFLAVLAALGYLAASSLASAQVQVTAQTARTNFLLYERVDILVSVSNVGESDLVLDNNEGQPWLSFMLARHVGHNYSPVKPERKSGFQAVTLKAGETKTLRINITPLFTFRNEGEYRAAAVIDLPGQGQIVSDYVPFNVVNGRKVWSQSRPVDGSQRIYSLIRFSPNSNHTDIYLRIEDPAMNLVYANMALGEIVSSTDPEAFFDPEGNLHILNPVSLGTYLYTRSDPNGKIQHHAIFKTFQTIPPRLHKLEDGSVTVAGGLEENAKSTRERLSDGQTAAPVDTAIVPKNTGQALKGPEDR